MSSDLQRVWVVMPDGHGGGSGRLRECRGKGIQFSGAPGPVGDFSELFASEAPSVDQRETCKSPVIFWELEESGVCAESLSHKHFTAV